MLCGAAMLYTFDGCQWLPFVSYLYLRLELKIHSDTINCLYCGRRRDLELMSSLVNRHLAPVRSIGVSVIARCPQGES